MEVPPYLACPLGGPSITYCLFSFSLGTLQEIRHCRLYFQQKEQESTEIQDEYRILLPRIKHTVNQELKAMMLDMYIHLAKFSVPINLWFDWHPLAAR